LTANLLRTFMLFFRQWGSVRVAREN
jgi:hypothetical protein